MSDATQELQEQIEPEILRVERKLKEDKLIGNEDVSITKMVWHDNVRPEEDLYLDQMIASYKNKGFDRKYPIEVYKDGAKYHVLCGNRRTLAAMRLKESEPDVFKELFPGGKLPCIVYDKLDVREAAIFRNDHSSDEDRIGLSEHGLYLAVKQLYLVGVTGQFDIAQKLDQFIKDKKTGKLKPNRSFIQPRVNLCQLPKFVEDEYIKLMREGRDATPVRWNQVATLFKHFNEERNEGYVKGDGPKFQEYWNKECLVSGPAKEPGPQMMKKSDLDLAGKRCSSTLGQLLILKITGQPVKIDGQPASIERIDGKIVEAETALYILSAIGESLGEKKFKPLYDAALAKRREEQQTAEEAAELEETPDH